MSLFRRPPQRAEQPIATQRQREWDAYRRQQAEQHSGWAPDPYDENDWSWECLRMVGAVEEDTDSVEHDPITGERVERARITLPPDIGSPINHEVHNGRISTQFGPDDKEQHGTEDQGR
ncbi:MAG: hypothetical protein ACXVXL_29990 [Solirubrobacteraceae bacterium]